jgi:hypothetical protein
VKAIYLELHPETSSVMGNSKERRLNDTVSLSQDTASKTGQSKRTIERKTSIGEKLWELSTSRKPQGFYATPQRQNSNVRVRFL